MTPSDARRAFGMRLVLAIALCAGQYLISVVYEMVQGYDVYIAFENARLFSYLTWLTPVFAAIPFSTGFAVDFRTRSITPQILRAGRSKYIRSKVLCTALSGGVACAVGLVLFYAILLPGGQMDLYQEAFCDVDGMIEVLLAGHPALYMAGLMGLRFLWGAFYATAALAFSAYCPNTYLVLCFPLFVHRMGLAFARQESVPYWMNLGMLGNGEIAMGFAPTMVIGFAVFSVLIALCAGLFSLGVGRRLEHG